MDDICYAIAWLVLEKALHLHCVFHGIRFKVNNEERLSWDNLSYFIDICNISYSPLHHHSLTKQSYVVHMNALCIIDCLNRWLIVIIMISLMLMLIVKDCAYSISLLYLSSDRACPVSTFSCTAYTTLFTFPTSPPPYYTHSSYHPDN